MTDTTIIENENATANNFNIDERAQRIRSMLRNSTTIWLDIAREVSAAKSRLNKNEFKLFLSKSAISTSIADKLLSIAKTKLLYLEDSKVYLDKLDGWTTLYEIAKLSNNEITDLFKSIDDNPEQALTRSYISKFKSKRLQHQDKIEIVATITLSTDKVRRLDKAEFQRFKNDLSDIRRIIDASVKAAELSVKTKKLSSLDAIVYNPASSLPSDVRSELGETLNTNTHNTVSNTDFISITTH